MKEKIYLIPVVYPEFKKSAENTIDITEYNIKSNTLKKLQNPRRSRIWGVKEGNQNKHFYQKMDKGDVLLFYNRDEYVYSGEVGVKFENQEISRHYWDGISANLLYSINDFQSLELPKEVINQACEYKEHYQPQSLSIVDTQPQWKLEQKYGSITDLLSNYR